MVVFFDIDGTLVDEATQILPSSACRAVERLGQNGHLAVVNTGRPYSHIDPRVRALPFGGWVCGCGMELYLNGRWLLRRAPDEALCRLVRDKVRECGMQVLYEAEEGILTDGPRSAGPAAVKEAGRMLKKGFSVLEIDSLPVPKFIKFVTHDAPGCRRAEFLRAMEPWFTCIDRGSTMVEYVLRGSSKAGGMARLLQELDLPREDVYAIGDSTNDLPMFSMAAHTACVGDGMQELKAQAELITAPVLEDGVEKALIRFGLI